ncbi:hypothetical protein EDC04DRAFT_2616847 [Pisolithus marmoratus]|nr:hypothetical protein EDC04DRAFT_2616847 [Pisolithus marmoratus]
MAYTNCVEWSSHAKGPSAKMYLINGNHQVALMQWIYKKDISHYHQAQMAWQDAKNEHEKADTEKHIKKFSTRLSEHAVWLVEFFDLGHLSLVVVGNILFIYPLHEGNSMIPIDEVHLGTGTLGMARPFHTVGVCHVFGWFRSPPAIIDGLTPI